MSEVAELDIVEVPLKDVQPYWRNPRKNDWTIPALKKSIERYGFNVPLVIDEKNVIVTGHARFRALQQLGWTSIPCVRTNMSQKELREFRVMDNRVQELTRYDEETLQKELTRIFDGTDLADFFAGSLDRVLDMDELTGNAVDIDFENMELPDLEEPKSETEDRSAVCPFCEHELTVEDVIDG